MISKYPSLNSCCYVLQVSELKLDQSHLVSCMSAVGQIFFLRSESEVNFSSVSLSSYVLLFSPTIIFTARRWTFSKTSLSWTNYGDQTGTANSKWHLKNCLYRSSVSDKDSRNLCQNCSLCTLQREHVHN